MNDHTDALAVERRMKEALKSIHAMCDSVARARQIREFSSDRRKVLLARYASPLISKGAGVASAEHQARANEAYQSELVTMEGQFLDAECVLAKHNALMATYEAARSLLSYSRETLRTLQG